MNYKNYSSSYASYSTSSYATKKEDHSVDAIKYLQEFKEKYPTTDKEMHIIGRTLRKEIISQNEQDEVLLIVTEYTTLWGHSEPDGKRNLALPSKPLRSELAAKPVSRPAGINVDPYSYNNNATSSISYPYTGFAIGSSEYPTYGPQPAAKTGTQFNTYLQQKHADEECEEETTDEAVPSLTSPGTSFNPSEDVHITIHEEPKEEKKEESYDKLLYEGQTIMRFEVYNKSTEPVRVVLQLTVEGDINLLYPMTPVVVELSAHSYKDLIILTKKNPQLGWGDLRYDFSVSETKPFALKSEPVDDYYKDSSAVMMYYTSDEVAVNISDVDLESEDLKAPAGKIACPRCTLHNDAGAVKCDICSFIFTSKAV